VTKLLNSPSKCHRGCITTTTIATSFFAITFFFSTKHPNVYISTERAFKDASFVHTRWVTKLLNSPQKRHRGCISTSFFAITFFFSTKHPNVYISTETALVDASFVHTRRVTKLLNSPRKRHRKCFATTFFAITFFFSTKHPNVYISSERAFVDASFVHTRWVTKLLNSPPNRHRKCFATTFFAITFFFSTKHPNVYTSAERAFVDASFVHTRRVTKLLNSPPNRHRGCISTSFFAITFFFSTKHPNVYISSERAFVDASFVHTRRVTKLLNSPPNRHRGFSRHFFRSKKNS
jgi:phage terminase large subunit-like protein